MATAAQNNLLEAPQRSENVLASDSLMMGVAFALVLTVIQRLVGFGRNILFCRLMTDEQLGQWSLIYSFVLTIAPLAVLGLPGCFGRFVQHFQNRNQLGVFLRRINWICGISTSLMALVLLAFPRALSWVMFREEGQTEIIYAFAFTLVAIALINYVTSLLEALRQVRIVTLLRFMSSILFTVIATALLLTMGNGTVALTIGLGLGAAVAILPAVWFLWKNRTTILGDGEPLSHKAMWLRIGPYAGWMWICNLLHNAFEVVDRYMLVHWSPVSAKTAQSFVGQYHSGRVIPIVLVGVATMLAGVLMPYMTAHWERNEKAKAQNQLNWSIKLIAIGFTFIGSCVLLFAPLLFETILQGRYNDGLAVLPLTIIYCTWFSLFIVGQDYLWVAEKGKLGVLAISFGLAANIALNATLIPPFGLWGAVWATAIANGSTLICVFALNWWIGAKPHSGCWISAVVPLMLLLPSQWCLLLLAFTIVLCGWTNAIFTDEEREQIEQLAQSVKAKATSRFK